MGPPARAEPSVATPARLRAKERAENFPVALRVLPTQLREDLRAVYDVVRVIDDLGDEAVGDRGAQLADFSADVVTLWEERAPRAAVLQRLAPVVEARQLAQEPFERLLQANLVDQSVRRYATYADLLDYCALSAAPIGRIVLDVFGATTEQRIAWSDEVCCALQVLEHCQDVAEDARAGRIYLPAEDLQFFGVEPGDLGATESTPHLRRLIEFQARRASRSLEAARPLIADLRGWARVAVAGYVAGGLATVDALRRSSGEVLPVGPRPRRRDVARHAVTLLRGGGR